MFNENTNKLKYDRTQENYFLNVEDLIKNLVRFVLISGSKLNLQFRKIIKNMVKC